MGKRRDDAQDVADDLLRTRHKVLAAVDLARLLEKRVRSLVAHGGRGGRLGLVRLDNLLGDAIGVLWPVRARAREGQRGRGAMRADGRGGERVIVEAVLGGSAFRRRCGLVDIHRRCRGMQRAGRGRKGDGRVGPLEPRSADHRIGEEDARHAYYKSG
jgi:hypothetical protein